jgi:hypothetical protein
MAIPSELRTLTDRIPQADGKRNRWLRKDKLLSMFALPWIRLLSYLLWYRKQQWQDNRDRLFRGGVTMSKFYVYRGRVVSAEVFTRKNEVENHIVQKCYEIFYDHEQPPLAKQRAALNIRSLTRDDEPINRWRETHETGASFIAVYAKKPDPFKG